MSQQPQRKKGRPDALLLILVIFLAVFGLVFLYSSSSYNGRVRFHDSFYYFKKQLFATALGLAAMYVVSETDYHFWVSLAPVVYLMSVVLSTAVLLVGQEINGSKRWLSLGPLSFQPSEFAKVAVILFLAWQIDRSRKKTSGIWFMCRTMATLLPIVGLVGSNNLSTAIIIFGITAGLIFMAHPNTKLFLSIAAVGVVLVAGIVIFLYLTVDPETNENFRIGRILVWLRPEEFADGMGYQTLQALYAIGSGGLLGRGLGNSIQKLGSVPEAQNDMIFSIVCEELGIAGGVMLLLMFAYLLYRLFFIAQNASDLLGKPDGNRNFYPYCATGDL